MTTEVEQQFFNVFGIEPISIKSYGYWLIKGSIVENDKGEKVVYPEITDRVLLGLICKLAKYWVLEAGLPVRLFSYDITELKDEIIKEPLNLIRIIKNEDRKTRFINEIQSLFRKDE